MASGGRPEPIHSLFGLALLAFSFCGPGQASKTSGSLGSGSGATPQTNPLQPIIDAHKHCLTQYQRIGVTFTGYGCIYYCEEPGLIGIDQYFEQGTPCIQKKKIFLWFTRVFRGTCQPDFQAVVNGDGYTECIEDTKTTR